MMFSDGDGLNGILSTLGRLVPRVAGSKSCRGGGEVVDADLSSSVHFSVKARKRTASAYVTNTTSICPYSSSTHIGDRKPRPQFLDYTL
jgi:hypothetical protein